MTAVAKPSIWPFLAWAVVGVGLGVAVLTPFTIGVLVALAVVAAGVVLVVWHGGRNASACGLIVGAGVLVLYVGYLNRSGPGDVCTADAGERHCVTEWSPLPWLAVGIVMVAVDAGLFLWLREVNRHLG
ncbi:MAG: hypothetical protein DLM56_13610 [Pseudonocardiales bacterium]|nr:MAG: hypothetical protein DLM56_13610 [Pseudonocardiales bacterium]